MENKFFNRLLDVRGGGLRLLFLLVLLNIVALLEVMGQTPPVPPCYQIADCDMLDVVLVKLPTSVSAGETPCLADVGCADPFRQATYKVYLRYKVPQPAINDPLPVLDFFADYSRLNVRVKLSSFPTHNSHIAKAKTQSCFSANHAATWAAPPPNAPMGGNFAILDMVSDQIMALDLNNNEQGSLPCGQPGVNQLHFQPATQGMNLPCPSGSLCSYVELFDVVINAYPGETITLNCEAPSEFVGFTDRDVKCSPLNCVTSLALPVVVPNTVATYTGTNNSTLLVSLTGTNINSQTRNCETDIALSVSGIPTTPITVSYLEFTVEASNLNKMTVVSVLPGATFNVNITDDGTKQYAHVLIEFNPAVSVLPLNPLILGKIIIDRPLAQNVAWSSTLKLINEDKSRVKTSAACTRIRLSSTDAVCSDTGDPQCQPGLATLNVSAFDNYNCAETQVKVGISSAGLNLTGLDLELTFAVSGTMTLDHFDFGDFAGSVQDPCPTSSAGCTNGTTNCYAISGNTLKVCFTNNPPNTIQISGTKNMNLFFAGTGCVEGVTVTRLNIGVPLLTSCVPEVNLSNSGLPHCAADIGGRIATEENAGLENVAVTLDGFNCGNTPNCSTSVLTTDGVSPGRYGFCPVCTCSDNILTPSHNVDPLNGVSTYDLVLISKHILGLEPLTSPYKMIAADANRSYSITTFDIVEIRKLILGIYIEYPNAPSWRFVPKNFIFLNPLNPFKPLFPEFIQILASQQNLDFVAIKVGDVNASATTSSRPANRPEVTLSWLPIATQAGATITVPVTYTGDRPAEAIQLGLRFDPTRLALIGPSKGTLPGYGEGNFNLNNAAKGEIRTLWIPDFAEPDRWVQPGDVLFYLTFKVLANTTHAEPLLSLDDALLENLAWTPEGQECTIAGAEVKQRDGHTLPEVSAAGWLKATCTPNPTSGTAALNIQSTTAGKARVWLFNAAGGRVLMRDVVLSADTPQDVALPEVAQLPAGVYLWKVAMSGERVEGRLVKE